MLSQFRSFRHTIMVLVTIASLMGLAPYSALATPMTYDFTFTAGAGNCNAASPLLCLKGSFTGEDKNNDGFIDSINGTGQVELTILMGKWFGGPPPTFLFSITDVSDFSDPDVVEFQYDIGMNVIKTLNVGGVNPFIYPAPPDANSACPTSPCILFGTDLGQRLEVTEQSVTPAAAAPAAVPEPGTAILLSLGLIGMILYAFARRLRPTAPRRVPVADTTR
jgi:hypothetical protein